MNSRGWMGRAGYPFEARRVRMRDGEISCVAVIAGETVVLSGAG